MYDTPVFAQTERFKLGWVAGFYDALSDDGSRYIDDILRYGLRDIDQHEFMVGYRHGRAMRLGTSLTDSVPPIATVTKAA